MKVCNACGISHEGDMPVCDPCLKSGQYVPEADGPSPADATRIADSRKLLRDMVDEHLSDGVVKHGPAHFHDAHPIIQAIKDLLTLEDELQDELVATSEELGEVRARLSSANIVLAENRALLTRKSTPALSDERTNNG